MRAADRDIAGRARLSHTSIAAGLAGVSPACVEAVGLAGVSPASTELPGSRASRPHPQSRRARGRLTRIHRAAGLAASRPHRGCRDRGHLARIRGGCRARGRLARIHRAARIASISPASGMPGSAGLAGVSPASTEPPGSRASRPHDVCKVRTSSMACSFVQFETLPITGARRLSSPQRVHRQIVEEPSPRHAHLPRLLSVLHDPCADQN